MLKPSTLKRRQARFAHEPHIAQHLLDDALALGFGNEDQIGIASPMSPIGQPDGLTRNRSRTAWTSPSPIARREPSTGAQVAIPSAGPLAASRGPLPLCVDVDDERDQEDQAADEDLVAE
jgi:hypothetical protein